MPFFTRSLAAWGTESYDEALKRDLSDLEPGELPLHAATNQGGRVDTSQMEVSVLQSIAGTTGITSIVTVFFLEVVGGCSCGEDPVSEPVHCRLRVAIDSASAATSFEVLSD